MNNANPIPHIIVVGILRVLLSTCPNTKKNTTGGVYIHREWSSSLKLYFVNKDFFDFHSFQSQIFPHDTLHKELERIAKVKKDKEAAEADKLLEEQKESLDNSLTVIGSDGEEKEDKKEATVKKNDTKEDEEEPEGLKDEDYFELEDYKYENDRHRIITAMIISDLFIYMLKHFKANCIN